MWYFLQLSEADVDKKFKDILKTDPMHQEITDKLAAIFLSCRLSSDVVSTISDYYKNIEHTRPIPQDFVVYFFDSDWETWLKNFFRLRVSGQWLEAEVDEKTMLALLKLAKNRWGKQMRVIRAYKIQADN